MFYLLLSLHNLLPFLHTRCHRTPYRLSLVSARQSCHTFAMPSPSELERPSAPSVVKPQGPNHDLNVLENLIDSQQAEGKLLETTTDPVLIDRLKKSRASRKKEMASTLHDFLFDPFATYPRSNFTDAQKHALRKVYDAAGAEKESPSDENKKKLTEEMSSLCALLDPEGIVSAIAGEEKVEMPKK